MIKGKILIARREDLKETVKEEPLEDLFITDLAVWGEFELMKNIHQSDFVLFVDDDGRQRIFKNRYGNDSVIF